MYESENQEEVILLGRAGCFINLFQPRSSSYDKVCKVFFHLSWLHLCLGCEFEFLFSVHRFKNIPKSEKSFWPV